MWPISDSSVNWSWSWTDLQAQKNNNKDIKRSMPSYWGKHGGLWSKHLLFNLEVVQWKPANLGAHDKKNKEKESQSSHLPRLYLLSDSHQHTIGTDVDQEWRKSRFNSDMTCVWFRTTYETDPNLNWKDPISCDFCCSQCYGEKKKNLSHIWAKEKNPI